jgi:hypothetical protein
MPLVLPFKFSLSLQVASGGACHCCLRLDDPALQSPAIMISDSLQVEVLVAVKQHLLTVRKSNEL